MGRSRHFYMRASEFKPLLVYLVCKLLTLMSDHMQTIGNHVGLTVGGSNGHFELNVFKPMIASSLLHVSGLIES